MTDRRLFCVIISALICWNQTITTLQAETKRSPNFIIILMDDMGWRDVGFMGNKFVETPNIDRLAAQGISFSQAYASAPNCAPTRACLMSGLYPPRHGVYTVVDPNQPADSPRNKILGADSKPELGTNFVTLAETLRDNGYATGFFGMWNLGRGRSGPVTPGGQGFSKVVFPETIAFAKDAYFDKGGKYLSDRLTDEVISFMEQSHDQPFFVYLPDHAVHAPFEPKPTLLKKYQTKLENTRSSDNPAYAATIEAVDENVGRILAALERLKITDNTYVIFTSDNGGSERDNTPLRGGKGQLYEGGIRVPLAILGPSIKTPGKTNDTPVASIDLYPTLLELAKLKQPVDLLLDGISLAPALRGEKIQRQQLFWHFPCYIGRGSPSSVIRAGDWKLIEFFDNREKLELYNLQDDPSETKNLATVNRNKTAELFRALQQWQTETKAAIPTQPNPKYDPTLRGKRGKKDQ
jgi:arylsulfatase A-like enzyme